MWQGTCLSSCLPFLSRDPQALSQSKRLTNTHAHTHTLQVLNVESETPGCVAEYTKLFLGFLLQKCAGLALDVAPLQPHSKKQ